MANVKISELPLATSVPRTSPLPVVASGITKRAPLSMLSPVVCPSSYGVVGDGSDEATTIAAMLAASAGAYILCENGKTYKSSTAQTLPTGCTLDLCGSSLTFIGTGTVKDLIMGDDSTVRNGTITNTGTAPSGGGDRQCPILIGDFGTGAGVKNVKVEQLTLDSNRPDGNLIGIFGGCTNIEVDGIYVADNSNIATVVDSEWGGDPAGTLSHPSNIRIKNIYTGNLSRTNATTVYLASTVNATLENIYSTAVNRSVVTLYAGDYGLSKATANIQALGFGGIIVRNARCDSATNRGVEVDMQAGISAEIYDCDGMVIESSGSRGASLSAGSGIVVSNARGVTVKNCFGTNHVIGLTVGANVQGLSVIGGRYWANNQDGINLSNGVSPNYCKIIRVKADGNGLAGGNYAGIRIANGDNNQVKECILGTSGEASQIFGIRVDTAATNVTVVDNYNIDCKDGGVAFSMGDATHWVTKRFSGNTSGAIGGGGQIYDGPNPIVVDQIDRGNTLPNNTSYVLFGTGAPAAGTWSVGDRWIQSTPVAGQPTGGMCTVAGTPGTWVNQANL